MKSKGLRAFLLVLAPLCGAWNGQGNGDVQWSPDRAAPGQALDTEIVGAVHKDVIEAVLVLTVPGLSGDGVLSLRITQGDRDVHLPHPGVRVWLHEYDAEGETLFRAVQPESGTLQVSGPGTGPLHIVLDATLVDAGQSRHIQAAFDLIPLESTRDEVTNPNTGETEAIYNPGGGCYGTWDEEETYSDPDEVNWEDEDSQSGCGGDDLDDDGPSGSGGCDDSSADDASDASDSADSSGCAGDNVDAESADSGCDCGADSIDSAALVACARGAGGRGGPRSPWPGRLVGWLPWFCVFGFMAVLRRRVRRERRVGGLKGPMISTL